MTSDLDYDSPLFILQAEAADAAERARNAQRQKKRKADPLPLRELERQNRDAVLLQPLPAENVGRKMLEKMGYKVTPLTPRARAHAAQQTPTAAPATQRRTATRWACTSETALSSRWWRCRERRSDAA